MVVVLADGENIYRLVNAAGSDVGWIRQKAIGFTGFDTEAAAIAAALEGGRALARSMRREFGVAHPAMSDEPRPRKVHDGAYHWVADGKVPVARLLRVEGDGSFRPFAIEFVLPSYANDAVAINAAQIIYGAIEPAGSVSPVGRVEPQSPAAVV